MDSNHRFRAEIGNAFTGAAPSSGVRRAMRKVASLAMRRQRGFSRIAGGTVGFVTTGLPSAASVGATSYSGIAGASAGLLNDTA